MGQKMLIPHIFYWLKLEKNTLNKKCTHQCNVILLKKTKCGLYYLTLSWSHSKKRRHCSCSGKKITFGNLMPGVKVLALPRIDIIFIYILGTDADIYGYQIVNIECHFHGLPELKKTFFKIINVWRVIFERIQPNVGHFIRGFQAFEK